jgi:pimeloyl-ACP methyl ester carboxylesterase
LVPSSFQFRRRQEPFPFSQLVDPDSQFIEVKGLGVHYKELGAGNETFILLHGFSASVYTWREVMQSFAELGRVVAYDRPAFGLTSRPLGLAERLAELSLPTLVIIGDDDRLVPTADSVKLAAEIPAAALVIIPQAGHLPHEEKPAEFMQAVRAWLEQ